MFNDYDEKRRDALYAGRRALDKLMEASSYLQKAGTWGYVDLFGGTWISTYAKHKRMKKAKSILKDAADYLGIFETELHELDRFRNINLKTADFLGVSDYFLDGLLTDALMLGRIRKAQAQIDEAIAVVEEVVSSLY